MKILIIEDDPSLREMLAITVAKRLDPKFELAKMETFAHVQRYFVGMHTLLLAENLGEALRMLPGADGVLCDGTFPTSGRTSPAFGGLRQNWPAVLGATSKRGIPFALLSGDDALVTRAKLQGMAAFAKPMETASAINWLFEAIESRAARLAAPIDQDKTAA